MTQLEKYSERKRKALYYQVKNGEKPVATALRDAEDLHDDGKLLDKDYEPLAEYLEGLLEAETENQTENLEEPVEDTAEELTESAEEIEENIEEE